jgi:ATP-dependent DNA helicase Rep
MGLDQNTVKEDPREKIRALRAEFAKRAADAAEVNAAKARADHTGSPF